MVKRGYPELVVGLYILNAQDKLLLVKAPKWGEQWMIPGGHVELGESVFETSKREAMEEVGLEIEPLGVLVMAEDIFPTTFHEPERHFFYLETICRAKTESVKMDNAEIRQTGWFGLEEALLLVKEPVLMRTIKSYIEQKKNGKISYINIGKHG